MKIIDDSYREYKTEWFRMMPYDYAGVEQHLSEMAAKGWILDEIGTFGWKYKKCQTAELKFSVTFLNSHVGGTLAEGAEVLDAYCLSEGWKKLIVWQKMHIYCTDNIEAAPLETDEISRLDNTWDAIKAGYIPQSIFLLLLQAVMLFQNISRHMEDGTKAGTEEILLFGTIGCALASQLVMCFCYWRWYKKSKENIEKGGRCSGMKGINVVGMLLLAAAAILLGVWSLATSSLQAAIIIAVAFIMISIAHRPVKANRIEVNCKGD
ncbi:MAG: DUF2812 domain-containing protein [Firmicutes bacterium]|nr:DUF2812 domain-containing protein [Bacillota bacterium]